MSEENKIKAAAKKVVGKAEEAIGKVTGDDRMAAEGKADQAEGHLRGAAENVKKAFKK